MEALREFDRKIEACFANIAATRMQGVPIVNGALSVKAVGTCEWQGGILSVLITPWFMNIIYQEDEEGEGASASIRAGTKRNISLPAGRFEFIRGHEEAVGSYWMCSLFSPVFEFADMETAEAAAAAAMEEILGGEIESEEDEIAMSRMWRGEIPEVPPAVERAGESEGSGGPEDGSDEEPADEPREPKGMSRRQLLAKFRPSLENGAKEGTSAK
jgi:[NiFe] hydrogenase assembly HybE family chaperone